MEFKSLDFEYKADRDKRIIKGYASTWEKDLGNDVIEKGAFTKTINERLPKNGIKILWQHSAPLGIPRVMEQDEKGLYIEGYISKTRLGDEALELINDGVVNQMSIGYDIVKDELSKDGQTRHLKELKLYEFSPVTFPMNEGAFITSVAKSRYDGFSINELSNLMIELKEGRTLSRKNVARIEDAIKNLQSVLTESTEKNYNPSDDSYNKNDFEPDNGFTQIIEEMKNYAKGAVK